MHLLDRFHSREDFHQSIEFARVMEGIGWCSIPVDGSRFVIKPLGPTALSKMQRPQVVDIRRIRQICKKLHILHFILEPAPKSVFVDLQGDTHTLSFLTAAEQVLAQKLLAQNGLKITTEHYAHTKTAIVDIAPTIDTLTSHFPSKTRYNIKLSLRGGITYRHISFADVTKKEKQDFYALHTKWSKEKHIFGFTNEFLDIVMDSFRDKGWLIAAYSGEEFMGAMMVLIHDRIGYYFYTCTSERGKRLHVPTGLAYQAILLSKKEGADIFDFCSMYDERYPSDHPRWKGFTTFKERFNPVPVYYPPSFGRWL